MDGFSDDEEDSCNVSLENELSAFRERWREELRTEKQNKLDQAIGLYHRGVEAEESGMVYEAVKWYRQAEQLEPNVEFHIRLETSDSESEESESELRDDTDLEIYFQKLVTKGNKPCQPLHPTTSTHLRDLPEEVFHYILRWVVSCDLDLRSLEQCSMVCRGFYLSARDSSLWRRACQRVWSDKNNNMYSSWREMWILRPHVRFNGCYISKTTYVRHGESSFQDEFYRPWHLVTYFRYLRFFPDGKVLMLTTPEEPSLIVSQLRYHNCGHSAVLTGDYCVFGNHLKAHLQKANKNRGKGRRTDSSSEQSFNLELEIRNCGRKPHWQLVWLEYFILLRRDSCGSNFEITSSRFPSFWFSRVRSYSLDGNAPV